MIAASMRDLVSRWQEGIRRAVIRIPLDKIESPAIDHFEALIQRFPGTSLLEFELCGHTGGLVTVSPREEVRINAVPEFVSGVERLFGEKSCILEAK